MNKYKDIFRKYLQNDFTSEINDNDLQYIYTYAMTLPDELKLYPSIFNENIYFDLLIYDEKFRKDIMQNINEINNLPLYMIIILSILKFFHYTLCFIPNSLYLYLKNGIFYSYFNKEIKYYKKEISSVIMIENFD